MKSQFGIGLLPLYLELYDEIDPKLREAFDPLLETVRDAFRNEGIGVIDADICRLESEFAAAVKQFEQEDVALIVTLHLAYSPSLESVDVLAQTQLPLLMLDVTMDHDFGLDVDPARLMYNHGIHGVMDLASMLRRRGKAFEIVAGHVTESPVLERAVAVACAAQAARLLKSMRVLRVGKTFQGMGDFAVSEQQLHETLGIVVEQAGPEILAAETQNVTKEDIEAELSKDMELFEVDAPREVHERSIRVGLALRKALGKGGYGAFSMNFLAFDSPSAPIDTVPFLEASKAMARGVGYAGEGDVLTAALVGALSMAFGSTTFTEVFCPDWKGGALFLSHMGEFNPAIAAARPRLCEKNFPWTPARNPAFITCAPAPGAAVLVNIAPGPDGTFSLILAPVEVLADGTHPDMQNTVRGWIRPQCPLNAFLEQYSRLGGTHHNALVLGDRVEALRAFAAFAGIECHTIVDSPHRA